ncbi:hypothetical protein BGZ51_000580 [Haplosporangium sp. Z 767]|nr:hypothetical protein BGZ51_000580 [Haplosporangium sp. Z 767]KAF9194936.1 hypothetical protein BGZ50_005569 [Haplosporangium sp. Z 11]
MKFSLTATAVTLLAIVASAAPSASNSTSELTKRADCFSYTLTKYNTITSGKDFRPDTGDVLGPRYLQFQMVISPNKYKSWTNVLWGQNAQTVNLPGMKLSYNTNNMEVTITVKGKAYKHKKANAGGSNDKYLLTDIHEYWGCMSALP